MAANVTYIPPKAANPEALRVAAYCRVSSDSSGRTFNACWPTAARERSIGCCASPSPASPGTPETALQP